MWGHYRVVLSIFKTRRNGLANKYKGDFTRLFQAQQANDIIIYCNQDRITKESATRFIDNINRAVFDLSDSYDSCERSVAQNVYPVAAWTMDMIESRGITVMQLCPWYLQQQFRKFISQQPAYVTPAVLHAAYQISISPSGQSGSPSEFGPPCADADIECFSFLDQLILHEVCITSYILHQPKQIMILRLMY